MENKSKTFHLIVGLSYAPHMHRLQVALDHPIAIEPEGGGNDSGEVAIII